MIVQRIYTKCMALPRLPHMMMMMTVFVGNTLEDAWQER